MKKILKKKNHKRKNQNGWVCGRRCERGAAATRDCSRLVEARSGACFCANGRSQERCRAMNSGLEPVRVPHMTAQGHVPIVENHRASEWPGASDVQTPSRHHNRCRCCAPRWRRPQVLNDRCKSNVTHCGSWYGVLHDGSRSNVRRCWCDVLHHSRGSRVGRCWCNVLRRSNVGIHSVRCRRSRIVLIDRCWCCVPNWRRREILANVLYCAEENPF